MIITRCLHYPHKTPIAEIYMIPLGLRVDCTRMPIGCLQDSLNLAKMSPTKYL